MADIEFFFDPICPWAWITSRLTVEVARQRELSVDWRFICLRMVNEEKDYNRDFPPGYVNAHRAGQRMLRIAAAARRDSGNPAVDSLYTAFGEQIHTAGRSKEIRDGDDSVISEAVELAGLPAALAAAGDDEELDAVIREETDAALSRTGKDVGTPIITLSPGRPGETSFFGPVLASVPRGEEALRIWDAFELLARTPGFAEVKRSARDRPTFA